MAMCGVLGPHQKLVLVCVLKNELEIHMTRTARVTILKIRYYGYIVLFIDGLGK